MSASLFSLEGRIALVTGGSRGIGKMIAQGFAAHGAKVYISSRKADQCAQTASDIGAISLPGDISTVEGAQRLAAEFVALEQSLDILVNNAGGIWMAEFDSYPEKGWDKVVDVNLKAPFFLTQAFTAIGRGTA